MRDKELYTQILGIQTPWEVSEIELDLKAGEVKVYVEQKPGTKQACPKCGASCPGYDKRRRQWRHLDTCQLKTLLVADLPRVQCAEHGVVSVHVPWSEPGSGFTALYEALVIDWLKEASTQAVSRQLSLSWNAIDGIMQRAVNRGLARRQVESPKRIGVDETSFRKGHDYVTIVSAGGKVLHVSDERKKASLESYYDTLSDAQKAEIESVSMDMWPAYIKATLENIPDADRKIAFDKFHVAKYLGEAVDKVRKQEHKALMCEGWEDLKGSKYDWLTNPGNLSRKRQRSFKLLRESTLKTARAWAIKDLAMRLWNYVSRTWAEKRWKQWLSWAFRSRLEPVRKVARTIKEHLWGILNAIILKANNAASESINSRIKTIKIRSRGFRNKARYKNAIYFHLGELDLYPDGVVR
jgi:transposase